MPSSKPLPACELHRIVKSCAEAMPLWTPHRECLLRRVGPVLQIILFNTSRWNSDLNPMHGFHFLGRESAALGFAAGDTLRGPKGTQLWVRSHIEVPELIVFS